MLTVITSIRVIASLLILYMKFKELEKEYEAKQKEQKELIKAEPNKWKRFWKWVWYWFIYPWKWVWVNIRDWRTALIFAIVFLAVSSEVWVFYLVGIITGSEWCLGVASACWVFWLGPGTPFMVIVIGLTMAVKALFNRIATRRKEWQKKKKK